MARFDAAVARRVGDGATARLAAGVARRVRGRATARFVASVLVLWVSIAAAGQTPAVQEPALLPAADLRQPVAWQDLLALRAFFERVDVLETAAGLRRPPVPTGREIDRLVGLFGGSWQRAFEYVRDRVQFDPYRGAVRGAEGTLAAGAANSLDQALLLRELLHAQGRSTRLVLGRLDWESAAALVVGAQPPADALPGDPWVRWVEAASDHWWLEVELEDGWTALDPSFSDAVAGGARGEPGRRVEAAPAEEVARLRLELLRGRVAALELELPTAEVVDIPVEVFLEPARVALDSAADLASGQEEPGAGEPPTSGEPPAGGEPPPGSPPRAGELPVGGGPPAAGGEPEGGAGAAGLEGLPAYDIFPQVVTFLNPEEVEPGPWMAVLRVGGRVQEAGPFEAADLPELRLRLRLTIPGAAPRELVAPWGAVAEGKLAVVVAAGRVPRSRLVGLARPLYETIAELGRVEVGARDSMRPPRAYADAADSLRDSASLAWSTFEELAPAAVGWALLEAVEGLSARSRAGRVVRPGLRLAAVRWWPPGPHGDGVVAVTLSDPVIFGNLSAGVTPGALQAAHGLLQSAAISQVLHRIADRAPRTPFDVTLLAVGRGVGLGLWTEPERLPTSWAAAARAYAAAGMPSGFSVLGPRAPQLLGGEEVVAWWEAGPSVGTARGWVMTGLGPVHGEVSFGRRGDPEVLDDLLASLPTLHRGLRWLATIGASDAELAAVSAAACASSAVAAESLRTALPEGWAHPAVELYCGGAGASRPP